MIHRLFKRPGRIPQELQDSLVLKGVLDGSRAFIGPEVVQFDITNRCNNHCLCCWNNSALLKEPSKEKKVELNQQLPFRLIKKTILELKEMGTKTLFFAGGGEPFMHPDIMGILECAKRCGMKVCLNTNFTLVDKPRAKKLVDIKVDLIHVSLMAGTPETYAAVHPGHKEESFFHITETLKYLLAYRRAKKQEGPVPFPHVDLYNVIFNRNCSDIPNMAGLAMELRVNSLEFTPVDVVPGATDCLLLNEDQRRYVLEEVREQFKKIEAFNEREGGKVVFIEQYEPFLKRLLGKEAVEGRYEARTVLDQPCYVGWSFLRILADGRVVPCLKAHRVPSGNIYEHSIKDIWNGKRQRLFREKTFFLDGSDPYFGSIGNNPGMSFGCLLSCDNIQINVEMHNKFQERLKSYGRIK